ncbi:MAG: DUF3604 domain-containing protein [Candidatus Hodarchaeota archaeon]
MTPETLKKTAPRKRIDPKLLRLLRICVYCFGMVSIVWFFFSFIAVTIGVLLLIALKDIKWKRNGFVLAIAASVGAFISHVGVGTSPLNFIFMTTFPIMGGFLIFMWIWEAMKKQDKHPRKWVNGVNKVMASFTKKKKAGLILILSAVPICLWSSVSINFDVMFNNETKMLWVHVPSTANLSTSFNVNVQAWDKYERLSATFKGTVSFSIESYNITDLTPIASPSANLPSSYTFTGQQIGSDMAQAINDGKDNGQHVFTARINTTGIHYLKVSDSLTGNTYYSNPIIVKNYTSNDYKIYWGDPHTHSMLSDGSGTAEEVFGYARDQACLDFYALTDHAEIMEFQLNAKDTLESTANEYYSPNEFVTFPGIEWTCVEEGHYTLIFSGNQLMKDQISSYFHVKTTPELWNKLDEFTSETGCRALAFPHHTTKNAYMQDWTHVNPKYVRLAEVSSTHGEFLFEQRHPLNYRGAQDPPPTYQNGSSIMDALIMGKMMGLSAASDSHDGHPGHSIAHAGAYHGHQRPLTTWATRLDKPYPGSLVAVYAQNLTREGVFSALENARVFANCEHGRPIINFTMNGTAVGDGSMLTVSTNSTPRNITVFLAQDGNPASVFKRSASSTISQGWIPNWNVKVEILRNGVLIESKTINQPVDVITYIDNETITGAVYGAESCIVKNGECYINEFSNNPVDPATLHTNGVDFYIIRIVSANGRTSYAGPIWVEVS